MIIIESGYLNINLHLDSFDLSEYTTKDVIKLINILSESISEQTSNPSDIKGPKEP